ncbi:hypothetical protein DFH94DRAFT_481817 [Russula ochroleuca]|uniref:Extracellular membrane protein CFEM domain-containing protein n=1 Tax=Russula ochroleuca TaxID=152965 RepID=A0A9P5JUC6_9AGAM|nr:hypothetical protein DFH94DRAFT_481817 [Russula ochroleuca]
MKGTSTVFLAVFATALVAVAKPSHSVIAGLLLRQSSSDLHARSGINPSSISAQCQPDCTTIIKNLDACTSATCECTQANFAALGVCINCLITLGPEFSGVSPGSDYVDS